MRKLIYATKADDLRAEMAQYDAETARLNDIQEEQTEAWQNRIREERAALENEVREAIGPSTIDDIRIRADLSWSGRNGDDYSDWDVSITVNDRSKWNEGTALAWNYDVKIDSDGNVKKETGSWSGLKATTPEQIDDLKESVRLIEKISNIDWASLLHRVSIKWDDFVDEDNANQARDRRKARPDYERQIDDAEMSEIIGKDVWVELDGSPSSTYGQDNRPYFAKILRETPARFEISLVPGQYFKTDGMNSWAVDNVTVNKQNFYKHLVHPINKETV